MASSSSGVGGDPRARTDSSRYDAKPHNLKSLPRAFRKLAKRTRTVLQAHAPPAAGQALSERGLWRALEADERLVLPGRSLARGLEQRRSHERARLGGALM
jgi:hypothetical protein